MFNLRLIVDQKSVTKCYVLFVFYHFFVNAFYSSLLLALFAYIILFIENSGVIIVGSMREKELGEPYNLQRINE